MRSNYPGTMFATDADTTAVRIELAKSFAASGVTGIAAGYTRTARSKVGRTNQMSATQLPDDDVECVHATCWQLA